MNKVALFDFCETLTDFQTADAYVDYVRKHIGTARMKRLETIQKILVWTKLIRILEKVTNYRLSLNKRLKLFQLKGLCKESLNFWARQYYENEIRPHFIDEILHLLQLKKQNGWEIIIVSGGYDIYLKFFAMEFDVKKVISTRIKFDDQLCMGAFDGLDCLNINKVNLLNRYIDKSLISESEAYSDSKSDVPFLSWVDKGFVVSKEKHQSWVEKFCFNEIIWIRNK